MIVKLLFILVAVVVVNTNKPCSFRTGKYSPYYWRDTPNVCTKDLCYSLPWLQCGVSRDYILDQAAGHYPEDIITEIAFLKKYFNTYLPIPRNTLPYTCTGICQESVKQLQLQRIFTDVMSYNSNTGYNETQKHMCIIIGPDIYYQQCGGKCKIPYSNGEGYSCAADVKVNMDVWVYCPEANPMCHKVRFGVPVSCSCKKVTCKSSATLPAFESIKPNAPLKPPGWDISMNPFHISKIDKKFDNHGPIQLGHGNPGLTPDNPVAIDLLPPNAHVPGWTPNNAGLGNQGHGNQGHGNQGHGNQGHVPMHIV